MTRAEIIAALQAALESRESALIAWERVKPAVREAIELVATHVPDVYGRCDRDDESEPSQSVIDAALELSASEFASVMPEFAPAYRASLEPPRIHFFGADGARISMSMIPGSLVIDQEGSADRHSLSERGGSVISVDGIPQFTAEDKAAWRRFLDDVEAKMQSMISGFDQDECPPKS